MRRRHLPPPDPADLLAEAEAHDRDAAAYLARFAEADAAGQPGLAASWARLEAIAREQAAEARSKAGVR